MRQLNLAKPSWTVGQLERRHQGITHQAINKYALYHSYFRLLYPLLSPIYKVGKILLAILLIWGIVLFIQSSWVQSYSNTYLNKIINISQKLGFTLDNILVEGRQRITISAILNSVVASKGDALLTLPINQIQENLHKNPWVKNINVIRKLPNTLLINITEYQPTALWQKDNDFYLISEEGTIITKTSIDNYKNLTIIKGDQAPIKFNDLKNALSTQKNLGHTIKYAEFINDRRWDIYLDNNVLIKLPEDNFNKGWQTLLELQEQSSLLNKNVQMLDLRLIDYPLIRFNNKATALINLLNSRASESKS
ncbi:MAG: FtsQ-type POTRA domain-containing protein [Alphaproteobacteria bacterium]|nr:FtsQ-type POTRA domain-containing protein [Alphaproteobacteria bacterium]